MARLASPNEVACTWRRLDKATSQQLAIFKVVRLSLASPAHEFEQQWGSPDAYQGLTHEKRQKVLCLTAASGSLPNLIVALVNAGLVVTAELLEAAAEAGQLEACKLLRERGCPWGGALAAAAKGGHRHVCEWALAGGCPLTPGAVYAAARGGHDGLMRWLLPQLRGGNNGAVDVVSLLEAGAEGLGLAALQRLLQQQPLEGGQRLQHQEGVDIGDEGLPPPPPVLTAKQQAQVLAAAAGSPTPDWQAKVEWLEGLGYPRTAGACVDAANRGSGADAVGRLRWLHARGYPLDEEAANVTVRLGDLAALRFLVEEAGVRPDDYAAWNAAEVGHLAVLQYLYGRGHVIHSPMLGLLAARGGHLALVAWLQSLGGTVIIRYANRTITGVSPYDTPELLDHGAAASGSVELMAWLWERGWAWSTEAISNAARSGCQEALEWLVQRGCPWPVDGGPYVESARLGDLAMIRCLHRLGCPWGDEKGLLSRCIHDSAVTPVPSLSLLVELGCPKPNWEAVTAAAEALPPREHRKALLEWLGEQRQLRQSSGA